jgi:Protein of unknown function (DUF3667)
MGNLCENCDEAVVGEYCTRCGQAIAGLDIPVGDFARDFASEALGLDSRVRLTLAPLFLDPGRVPLDFVMGQRARFVPPIRLYLLASFMMFLILSFSPIEVKEVVTATALADSVSAELAPTPASPGANGFGSRLEQRFVAGFEAISTDVEGFSKLFMSRLAQSMFFLLPAFALLLKLAYRKRFYVHHVIFALYEHSVVFLLVAALALPAVMGVPSVSEWLDVLLLTVPIHLVVAMHRFYGESWIRTTAKSVAVLVAYTMVGATTIMLLFVVSLLTI